MEYQFESTGNSIVPTIHTNYYSTEIWPMPSVDSRLKENKQRKLQIEKEKQKQNEHILMKRKQKEESVNKILQKRYRNREGVKAIFDSVRKACTNQYEGEADPNLKKHNIEEKINSCRNRANLYKTMYQKKIHNQREQREKCVKEKLFSKEKQVIDKSLNFHLAQWRSYQKKVAQKYKGQLKYPMRMYQQNKIKQGYVAELIEKHKKQSVQQLENNEKQNKGSPQETELQKKAQKNVKNNKVQKDSPILTVRQIGQFGMKKSVKNPQKIIKSMQQFIQNNMTIVDSSQDKELFQRFEVFLCGLQIDENV